MSLASIRDNIRDGIRIGALLCNITVPLLSVAYMIYAVISGVGERWLNIAVGAVSLFYVIFCLATFGMHGKDARRMKKKTKHAYKLMKLFLRCVSVGVTIYGIYVAATNVNIVTVLFALFALIGVIVQISLEMMLLALGVGKRIAVKEIKKRIPIGKKDG